MPRAGAVSLGLGDCGEAVLDLQHRLSLLGYSVEGELREFGSATEASLRGFQASRGLVADGICGPHTWSALVEADNRLGDRLLYYRSPMMRGDDVEDLQRQLGRLGFDARWVDGVFGPATQAATRQFQQNVGLPGDGVVGRETVEALQRLAGRSPGAITVAEVREHERLRHQSAGVAGRRIIIGDTGDLPVVAQAIARQLRRSGAEVIAFSTPDLSHQARTSNQWGGDVYLGVSLAADDFTASYFAISGFVSVGGQALANHCARVLSPLLPSEVCAVGMRLPILRQTRMPAVWCRVGPGHVAVANAALLSRAFVRALTEWCHEPFPTTGNP